MKKAFTIIELLVVVAVIAMLAALLLPALSQAKATTKRIVCSNNLKQIGIATFSYIGDYIEQMPADTSGNRHMNYFLSPYLSNIKWLDANCPHYSPTFICPSDNVERNAIYLSPKLSYGRNVGFSPYKVTDPLTIRGPTSIDGSCRYNQIEAPANTVYIFELWKNYNVQQYSGGGEAAPGYQSFVCSLFWHGGRMNMLFCDGHVKDTSIYDYRESWATIRK